MKDANKKAQRLLKRRIAELCLHYPPEMVVNALDMVEDEIGQQVLTEDLAREVVSRVKVYLK